MRKSTGRLARLIASTAIVAALGMAGASTASAATWSHTGQAKLTGNLTLTKGTSTITCTNYEVSAPMGPTIFYEPYYPGAFVGDTCDNGLKLMFSLWAAPTQRGGQYYFDNRHLQGLTTPPSPWGGNYLFAGFEVPFYNPVGPLPAKIVFSNTHIGSAITVTGTLRMTTSTGGLITMS